MRVGFQVDQLWFKPPGGIGTYVRELAPQLAGDPSLDLSVFHCRFSRGGPDPAWLASFGVLDVPATIRTLYPQWGVFGRPKLPPAFDDLHIVHATNPAGVPPVRMGQKLVVTVHDLAFERFPELFPREWRWLYKAGLRAAIGRADAIIVPSQATADDLADRVDPAKVHVTRLAASLPADPAPPETLERLGIPRPYVLFVGTVEPRKNIVRLVRSYRQVAPDVPHALVLAGANGWKTEELEYELSREGPGTIVRTGRVTEHELDALYRGTDAFVYPSLYEGFGLPVLEALARGVPTVTSTNPALTELAGDAALSIDPDDVAALAEAIARILTDSRMADDLGRRGLQRAAAFSWPSTARATLGVYRTLTGTRTHEPTDGAS